MAFTRYKNRRGLAAEWTFHNPVLADGELGFEKDTQYFKIGDGTASWTNLPYCNDPDVIAHVSATVDAHDASAISFVPAGMVQSTNVQAAIEELWVEKSATTHSHGSDAGNTAFTPSGNISATTVQGAIVELDAEKSPLGHSHGASGAKSTIGAGLPSFSGRLTGDFHYNTSTNRLHILTGAAGASATIATATGTAGTTVAPSADVITNSGGLLVSADVANNQLTDDVRIYFEGVNTTGSGGYFFSAFNGSWRIVNNVGATILSATHTGFTAGSPNSYHVDISHNGTGAITVAINGTTVITGQAPTTFNGRYVGLSLQAAITPAQVVSNFTALRTGTLVWLSTDEYVANHTHARGPWNAFNSYGLGDLVYLNNVLYSAKTSIAAPTTGFTDTFDRADENPLVNGWVKAGFATNPLRIVNNRAVGIGYAGSAHLLNLANNIDVSVDLVLGSTDAGQIYYVISDTSNFVTSSYYFALYVNPDGSLNYRFAGGSETVLKAAGTYPKGIVRTYRIKRVSTTLIEVYVNGVLAGSIANYNLLGDYVTIAATSGPADGSTYFDNLVGGTGNTFQTADWLVTKPADPIYLQAQLASGNVTTGTNVLKPGLRVPAASTLTEIVLRCETAPVGASITVAVERFNNGTSQGVIGTVSIPTGENVGSTVGLSGGCAKGDILKFNITSIGSTTAGADLTISLDLR